METSAKISGTLRSRRSAEVSLHHIVWCGCQTLVPLTSTDYMLGGVGVGFSIPSCCAITFCVLVLLTCKCAPENLFLSAVNFVLLACSHKRISKQFLLHCIFHLYHIQHFQRVEFPTASANSLKQSAKDRILMTGFAPRSAGNLRAGRGHSNNT